MKNKKKTKQNKEVSHGLRNKNCNLHALWIDWKIGKVEEWKSGRRRLEDWKTGRLDDCRAFIIETIS